MTTPTSPTGLLYSQLGYDLGQPIHVMVRGPAGLLTPHARFALLDAAGGTLAAGAVPAWGELWGSRWWRLDLTPHIKAAGRYSVAIHDGGIERLRTESFEVAAHLLWMRSWFPVAIEQAECRAPLAMNKIGWQDCGAAWQEANSHAAYVIGMTDVLEFAATGLSADERTRLEKQIVNGLEYLARLQDRAATLGHGLGAVCHQMPRFEEYALPGDAVKAGIAWARAARLLAAIQGEKKTDYHGRARRAQAWLQASRPLSADPFQHALHGAPAGFTPPEEWMTRDLVAMLWLAVELARLGDADQRGICRDLARQVGARQVPQAKAEGQFYGHFYTYASSDITEKAWIHHLEKNLMTADVGGHFPHYVLPLAIMLQLWPDDPDAPRWKETLHDFAFGFLVPACAANPFHLLPQGYYPGQGLLWFAGLWHGINAVYPLAAVLGIELGRIFGPAPFADLIAGNLQWIAGLNAGVTRASLFASVVWKDDIPADAAVPCSMLNRVGRYTAGTWFNARGSICNGFSTGHQFHFDVAPTLANDGPHAFTDEDWITHAGAWLSALARLQQ